MTAAVKIENVVHRYGAKVALDGVSFDVPRGQIFGLLGPNGSGKTTLFRLLSTLIPVQSGTIRIGDDDVVSQQASVRRRIGVVFQSPSIDKKLTVEENLNQQAVLYGLGGTSFATRKADVVARLGLAAHLKERAEKLSGGMRRRVDVAKGLLHAPEVLLLDEPSTGVDPAARLEFWRSLVDLRDTTGATIILTTHLLEEADKCDRLCVMDRGKVVAVDSPTALRDQMRGETLTLQGNAPEELIREVQQRLGLAGTLVDGAIRFAVDDGPQWVPRLAEAFPGRLTSITVGKPTLEDFFVAKTGRRFDREVEA
jgi:ABC-2 type transport system ATP-binding protein